MNIAGNHVCIFTLQAFCNHPTVTHPTISKKGWFTFYPKQKGGKVNRAGDEKSSGKVNKGKSSRKVGSGSCVTH
ncbi:unnamed protein product [Victoria cruziana]